MARLLLNVKGRRRSRYGSHKPRSWKSDATANPSMSQSMRAILA